MLEPDDFIQKKTEEVRRNLSLDTLRKVKRVAEDQKNKSNKQKQTEDDLKPAESWLDEIEID